MESIIWGHTIYIVTRKCLIDVSPPDFGDFFPPWTFLFQAPAYKLLRKVSNPDKLLKQYTYTVFCFWKFVERSEHIVFCFAS